MLDQRPGQVLELLATDSFFAITAKTISKRTPLVCKLLSLSEISTSCIALVRLSADSVHPHSQNWFRQTTFISYLSYSNKLAAPPSLIVRFDAPSIYFGGFDSSLRVLMHTLHD